MSFEENWESSESSDLACAQRLARSVHYIFSFYSLEDEKKMEAYRLR